MDLCIHERIADGIEWARFFVTLSIYGLVIGLGLIHSDDLIPIVVLGYIVGDGILLGILIKALRCNCHLPMIMHDHPHNTQLIPGAAGDAA